MSKQAVGIIETRGLVSLLEASDAALKAADITMLGWAKIGAGMVTGFYSGDVAAVKAGVDAGAEAASQVGEVTATQVIPRPQEGLAGLVEM